MTMAKEGSVAPKERINVTFKPATGGAQEEIELPLKLMVLGDFTQRADDRKIEDRKPISIDKNSFDEVLAKQELNLTFAVPNRLQDDAEGDDMAVQLRINSMKDFNPANLVDQVGRVEVLHRVDAQLHGHVVAFSVVLQAIRHGEGQVEFLLGQHFVEAVLVDADRLAVFDLAIVGALGEVTQNHQFQWQFDLFLSTTGGGFESDVDAFLGGYRAFFGHGHSPLRLWPEGLVQYHFKIEVAQPAVDLFLAFTHRVVLRQQLTTAVQHAQYVQGEIGFPVAEAAGL